MTQQRRLRPSRRPHQWALLCCSYLAVGILGGCDGFLVVQQSSSSRTLHSLLQMVSSSTCVTSTSTALSVVDLKTTEFSNEQQHQEVPVLLLHGLLGNKRNFATIGASLASQLERKRRIVAVDLRNHGENTHDWRDDMSYSSMANDILHLLDKNDMEKAVIVGHSVGGKVAQMLALQAPDRVEGLVVLDIAPVEYTPDEPHWKAVSDIIQVLLDIPEGTKREVDLLLRDKVPDPALRAFLLTNLGSDGKWNIPVHTIATQLEQLAGFDVAADSRYNGDSFFIHGGQSRFVRHAHIESIQQYFPNHMLTTIRGVGHWVHAEAPDDTIALLKKYLDR